MPLAAGMNTADLTGTIMLRYISKTLLKVREKRARGERERVCVCVCVCVYVIVNPQDT